MSACAICIQAQLCDSDVFIVERVTIMLIAVLIFAINSCKINGSITYQYSLLHLHTCVCYVTCTCSSYHMMQVHHRSLTRFLSIIPTFSPNSSDRKLDSEKRKGSEAKPRRPSEGKRASKEATKGGVVCAYSRGMTALGLY